MEFRNVCSVLGATGLNYEQRSCLVCNAPYICNLAQAQPPAASAPPFGWTPPPTPGSHQPASCPTRAFCKAFQIDDEATNARSNCNGDRDLRQQQGQKTATASASINPFCHSCSLKVQNLQQLQAQCELIQAQILTIRDELGYCLISTFSTANLTDANYALKLKVFQKWGFKYLPSAQQRSGDSGNGGVSMNLHRADQHQHQNFLHASRQPSPAHSLPLQQVHLNLNSASAPVSVSTRADTVSQSVLNAFHSHDQDSWSVRSTASSTPARSDAFDDEQNSISSQSQPRSRNTCGFEDRNGELVKTAIAKRRKKASESSDKLDVAAEEAAVTGGDLEQCFICGKMLTNDYLRKNHMQTHSDLRPYKCSMCDKSFANASYKKMHEKTHDKSRLQGEPKFSCCKCGRKYHLQKGLYKHMRYSPTCGTTTLVDHGKVRCQCELCGREFNSRYRLGVHVRGFHKKLRPVSCTICGRPCVDNQQRKKHELTHNPSPSKRYLLKCPECPSDAPTLHEFDRKRDLEKHYASEHPQSKVPNIRRPTRHPRKFRCEICPDSVDATFTEKRALEYHMERFHTPTTKTKAGARPRQCPGFKNPPTRKRKRKTNSSQCSRSAPELERQSRRISEKYRNMRSVRYNDEFDVNEDEGEKDSNSDSDPGRELDQKDFEIDDSNCEFASPSAEDFLQVKLEPDDKVECQDQSQNCRLDQNPEPD